MAKLNEGDVERLLQGYSRKEWAEVLEEKSAGVLDKWIQRHYIPLDALPLITDMSKVISNLRGSKPTLKEIRDSIKETTNTEDAVHGDIAPGGDLSLFTLDQLVDEIEFRGWKVQISRKPDEE